MGGNLTASSIREDIGTVSYQIDSQIHALPTAPPVSHPLLHVTLFLSYELQFTQFDIKFGMSSKAVEYSSGCDWRSIPPHKRVEFASCRDTKPEILMVKDEMSRCTSSSCSLKLQLMLQEGQDDLEPVMIPLYNNQREITLF